MARFVRSPEPPEYAKYQDYKPLLRKDFESRCAYCDMTEGYLRGSDAFGVDHFRPKSLFPELECVYSNLYYCCNDCNRSKGAQFPSEELLSRGIRIVDPCIDDPFPDHYAELPSGLLSAATRAGEYSIQIIRLNREKCVRFRKRRSEVAERIEQMRFALAQVRRTEETLPIISELELELADRAAEWAELYDGDSATETFLTPHHPDAPPS